MDFIFSFLDKVGVTLILKMMLFELLVGAIIGLGKKELARLQAILTPTKQVFSAKEYTSAFFGQNLPRGAFNPFALAPSLVVVEHGNGQIKQETFYSPLGDHTSFVDGQPTFLGSSVLSSPTYLMIATLPMLLGFIGALFLSWVPFINKYALSYAASGVAWNMLILFVSVFVYRTWENSTTSE